MPYSDEQLSQLELEDEARKRELSIEEKKALIAEAKKRYGKDWSKMFSSFSGKGSGMDWAALKFRMQ